jgi:hypothetical protein
MNDTRRRRGEGIGSVEPDSAPAAPNSAPAAPNSAPAAPETLPASAGPDAMRAIESAAEGLAGAIAGGWAAFTDRIARAISPEPLANLYSLHPEARLTSPRELGFRFVAVEDIRGTAVAGIAQRGQDFLPLPPFRGENWNARWQRIRDANARLKPLPPIDVVKYDGAFWVVDGHNRVAAALADRAAGLDAMVTELVPLDGRSSERPTALLPHLGEMAELRAAAAGHRPAMGVRVATPTPAPEEERTAVEGEAPAAVAGTQAADEAGASPDGTGAFADGTGASETRGRVAERGPRGGGEPPTRRRGRLS